MITFTNTDKHLLQILASKLSNNCTIVQSPIHASTSLYPKRKRIKINRSWDAKFLSISIPFLHESITEGRNITTSFVKIRRVCFHFDDALEGKERSDPVQQSSRVAGTSLSASIRSSPCTGRAYTRAARQTASNRSFQIWGHDNARDTFHHSVFFARRCFIVAKRGKEKRKVVFLCPFFSCFFFWEILRNFEIFQLVRFILVSERKTKNFYYYFCCVNICWIYGINIESMELYL